MDNDNHPSTYLKDVLQSMTRDLVEHFGYIGAMIATMEHSADGKRCLPVKAFYYTPSFRSRVSETENRLTNMMRKARVNLARVSLANTSLAYVCLDEDSGNLGVQAVRQVEAGEGATMVSKKLFSLFYPRLPSSTEPVIESIQRNMGIKEVVSVPFTLVVNQAGRQEVVGNLFVASHTEFSESEKSRLVFFGKCAARIIETHRLNELLGGLNEELGRVNEELQRNIAVKEESLESNLQLIVREVVERFGYVGAMIATMEEDAWLPVRAYYFPMLQNTYPEIVQKLKTPFRSHDPLADPSFARVQISEEYADNLAVQAVNKKGPVTSHDLFSLFTPVLGRKAEAAAIRGYQKVTGIREVIAVPFFLPEHEDPVGNMFVASSTEFTPVEIATLKAFSTRAAVAIHYAQLYEKLYGTIETQREEVRKLSIRHRDNMMASVVYGRLNLRIASETHNWANTIGAFNVFFGELLQEWEHSESLQEIIPEDNMKSAWKALEELSGSLSLLDTPIQQKECDLSEIVRFCGVRFESRHSGDLNSFRTRLAVNVAGNIQFKGDATILEEIISNLLENAFSAIQERRPKKGEIRLGLFVKEDGGIRLSVSDNGIGISDQDRDNVFRFKWSSGTNPGSRAKQRHGVGLFVAESYVRYVNGNIFFESQPGQGTEFVIDFPPASSPNDHDVLLVED